MGLKFTDYHDVAYYECDFTQTMTLPMLLSVIIKTSESQSYKLNIDNPTIVEDHGLGWVITNYDINIHRLPRQNERIFITTKADSYNKFFCYRDFWVHDELGHELVQINSIFVLMNLESRKIVSIPKDIVAPYQAEKTTKVRRFDKIPSIESPKNSESYRVRFFDLDGNQHVNNAKYFNWILDPLDFDFLTSHQPTHVSIRFDKEIEYGNIVHSEWELHKDNEEIYSLHRIMMNDTVSAEAKINWKQKNNEY